MGQQSSAPKITQQDKAIFQLKQQRDKIKQYQTKLNYIVIKQTNLARKAITNGQPDRAKFYLQSKKRQESVINKTYEQLTNLEKLIDTIEFKLIEKDVIYGLKQGNEILNKLNNEMKIEKIDKILDDLEDNKIKVNEVSEALGSGHNLNRAEEDEVDAEFNKLNEEINGVSESKLPEFNQLNEEINGVPESKLPEAPKDKIMPEIPTNEIQEPTKEEEASKEEHKNEPIAI
ncbi:unnamed protein product [Candida verbasci]|uniref:Charged multivesicular body protein 6 n=1 Tax=Candida verbasci TaxID=1227364 RepID=A0A9W4TSE6_9ASCO|nr:unnamed protein product [Candida verbasci]